MATNDEEGSEYRGISPPPDDAPLRSERLWIDRPVDLIAMTRLLLETRVIAVDAEFVTARATDTSQAPRLALIQIADARRCYVVDAIRLNDLTPLNVVFDSPDVLKIFHGVGSDLRVLRSRDIHTRTLLDIEAVSRAIFGQHESSLQAMLQRACGVHVDKTLQRSDWTMRPLSTAMFAYAARDAEMTYALYEWLLRHYGWVIDLYMERDGDPRPEDLTTPWLAQFIGGDRSFPQDLATSVTEAALTRDCIEALEIVARPPWRARIFRAAADLVLTEIIPYARPALRAASADARSAAARARGRLRAQEARDDLTLALDDPVLDVRRAAGNALEQLDLPPRPPRFTRGVTPEIVAESGATGEIDTPWKMLLRDFLDKND